MKNIVFIMLMVLIGLSVAAQDNSYTLNTSGSPRGSFWTDTDTVEASDTLRIAIRIKNPSVMDLQFQLKSTKISGTLTNAFVFSGSNDGVAYLELDTIVNTSGSTNTQWMNLDDFNYSYLRIQNINSATAQSATFDCDYSFRKE